MIANDLSGYCIRFSPQSVRFYIRLFCLIIFSSYIVPILGQQKVTEKYILKRIQDTKNKNRRNDSTVTVLIFLAIECPISQKYMTRLEEIKQTYKTSAVQFIGIIPGFDTWPNVEAFKKQYLSTIPFMRDKKMKLSKRLGATVTPEVFVIDKEYHLAYHGALDNWFYSLGRNRVEATENYLTDAIDSVMKNELVKLKHTQPIGCLIEFH